MLSRFSLSLVTGIVLTQAALQARADTATVSLEDFNASGVLGYTFNGSEKIYGTAGIFRLRVSDPAGPLANSLSDPSYGFCMDILQNFTGSPEPYDVGDLTIANDPTNPFTGPVTPQQRDLVAQLWHLYFDPSWTLLGPYSDAQRTGAIAFHAALFEIILDFDGASLSSLDSGSGLFTAEDGFIDDKDDPSQELPVVATLDTYLAGLSLPYDGPLAPVVALTNPEYQDYVTVVVPEVSSVTLALLGFASCGFVLRRRVRKAQ